MLEGGRFGDAEHRIHVLDSLTRGALDQIVEGRDEDRPVRHAVARQPDQTEVGGPDMTCRPLF